MLRVFVELLSSVASTFQMVRKILKRDWHAQDDDLVLPRVTNDTIIKETTATLQRSTQIALMLRDREAIISKHEGVLTAVSHIAPSPSVSLAPQAIHLPLLRRWRQGNEGELPPSVRRTGGGGMRAIARLTEGALFLRT